MKTESPRPTELAMPVPGAPPAPTVPSPVRFTLDSGLRVVAITRRDLPQIAARLLIPAGSSADPAGSPGVGSLVASLLIEGTRDMSANELNERIDALGASICARAGHDFAEVDVGLLSETLEPGLDLLARVVTDAAFPEREVERVRAEALDAFEARLDEPANVAEDRVAEALYGPRHPYGRLPIGTPQSVRSLQRDQLIEFHAARFRADGSVLVIAGDFSVDELRPVLDRAFSTWGGTVASVPYPPPPERAHEAGALSGIHWPDGAQAEIRFAGIGIARSSPDWVAAAVANYILGGSTITGRLGANLREDKGWTYGVRSSFSAGVHPAGWIVETAVDADVTGAALDEIQREITRMVEEPVAEEELDRAREAMILSLPRAFETPGRIVARLATVEAFGLPLDYWSAFPAEVARVTVDDVLRIARSHFDPTRLVRVAVSPAISG